MVKSAAAICRYYGWSEKSTIGHLEWSDWKIDPRGFTMAKFRADVKAALALPAGKWGSDLADTGGSAVALSRDDIHNIWYADEIPAQPEPYENEDWHKGNKTWTVKYTLYTIVRAGREILARVKGLEKSVAEVGTPTVDLDALATKIVAQLGDDLADVITDKLAERLKS